MPTYPSDEDKILVTKFAQSPPKKEIRKVIKNIKINFNNFLKLSTSIILSNPLSGF